MHDRDLSAAAFEALEMPLLVIDEARTIVRSNAAADELFGFAGDGLAARPLEEIVDPDYHAGLDERWAAAMAAGGSAGQNGHFCARSGKALEMAFAVYPAIAEGHSLLVVRDVAETRLRDAEIELRAQLLDQIDAAVVVVDEQRRIVVWNTGAERLYGWPRAAAIGRTGEELGMVVNEEDELEAERARGRLDAGGRSQVQIQVRRRDGTIVPVEAHGSVIRRPDGGVAQRAYVVIDVSDREEREDQLRRRARMQQAVADFGRAALTAPDLGELMDTACAKVADLLDAPFVKVMELEPGSPDLILRSAVGWAPAAIDTPHVSAVDSHAGHALETAEPILLEDLELEWRFHGTEPLRERAIRSGIAVVIPGQEGPYGVMAAHHRDPGHFDFDQAAFVESVANVLAAAIAHERQRA
jgi:PAS domain S-box-containing protein